MNRKKSNSRTGLILIIVGIIAVGVVAAILIINFKKGKTGGDIKSQLDKQHEQIDYEKDVIAYGDDESDSYDFTGDYFDTSTLKGTITIAKADNGYSVNITYPESDDAMTIWKMTASYDPYRKALVYRDCTRSDYIMASDEDSEPKVVYSDGSGFIYMASKKFYWVDDKEDMGAGLLFKKVGEEDFVDEEGSEAATEESGEAATEEGAAEGTTTEEGGESAAEESGEAAAEEAAGTGEAAE
ncbi:MAG: hypothetical protein K6B14_07815 [Lachnospiraceae bacterium]|nr:hypothetical protein [Lachnospiraceae bacterium]